jgi:hypothetical protein
MKHKKMNLKQFDIIENRRRRPQAKGVTVEALFC